MQDHYARIYRQRAADYAALVAREDHAGRLLPAILRIHPVAGADVVELGAGTGRLTNMLAPLARRLYALDQSRAMLAQAMGWVTNNPVAHLTVADHRALPLHDDSADLVIEGWAFAHLLDERDDRRASVVPALAEVDGVLRADHVVRFVHYLSNLRDESCKWKVDAPHDHERIPVHRRCCHLACRCLRRRAGTRRGFGR